MEGYEYEVRFESLARTDGLRNVWRHRTETVRDRSHGERLVQILRRAEIDGQVPKFNPYGDIHIHISDLVRQPRLYSRPTPAAWERVL